MFRRKKNKKKEQKRRTQLKSLTLAPTDIRISVDENFIKHIKDLLIKRDEPIKKGTFININLLGHSISFYVLSCQPFEGFITKNTELKLLSEFPERIKGDVYKLEVIILSPSQEITLNKGDYIIANIPLNEDKLKIYIMRYKGKKNFTRPEG